MEVTDPLKVIEIFNQQDTTRHIARKYGITCATVARIKGGTGPYFDIIKQYKAVGLTRLRMEVFGHDEEYRCFKNARDNRRDTQKIMAPCPVQRSA